MVNGAMVLSPTSVFSTHLTVYPFTSQPVDRKSTIKTAPWPTSLTAEVNLSSPTSALWFTALSTARITIVQSYWLIFDQTVASSHGCYWYYYRDNALIHRRRRRLSPRSFVLERCQPESIVVDHRRRRRIVIYRPSENAT